MLSFPYNFSFFGYCKNLERAAFSRRWPSTEYFVWSSVVPLLRGFIKEAHIIPFVRASSKLSAVVLSLPYAVPLIVFTGLCRYSSTFRPWGMLKLLCSAMSFICGLFLKRKGRIHASAPIQGSNSFRAFCLVHEFDVQLSWRQSYTQWILTSGINSFASLYKYHFIIFFPGNKVHKRLQKYPKLHILNRPPNKANDYYSLLSREYFQLLSLTSISSPMLSSSPFPSAYSESSS